MWGENLGFLCADRNAGNLGDVDAGERLRIEVGSQAVAVGYTGTLQFAAFSGEVVGSVQGFGLSRNGLGLAAHGCLLLLDAGSLLLAERCQGGVYLREGVDPAVQVADGNVEVSKLVFQAGHFGITLFELALQAAHSPAELAGFAFCCFQIAGEFGNDRTVVGEQFVDHLNVCQYLLLAVAFELRTISCR